MLKRRHFVKLAALATLGLAIPSHTIPVKDNYQEEINPKKFLMLPSPDYINVNHEPIKWEYAAKGLDFSRTEIYRDKKLVDVITTLKINPNTNKIRVFNGNNETGTRSSLIEAWQEETGALAMINGNQYMLDPHLYPCALVICDGEQKGPKFNQSSQGMLVAEPKDLEGKLKKADIIDFNFNPETGEKNNYYEFQIAYQRLKNSKDPKNIEKAKWYLEQYKNIYQDIRKNTLEKYLQGVQHWPILLDREGRIKVKETDWQANRTVVAKTKEDEILFMTTEGGYFTLYNFGRFLKESNERADKGFNVHTAMNMDGGYEAEMAVKTPNISYLTYGEFETQGKGINLTIFDIKLTIPGVIGVFPRD